MSSYKYGKNWVTLTKLKGSIVGHCYDWSFGWVTFGSDVTLKKQIEDRNKKSDQQKDGWRLLKKEGIAFEIERCDENFPRKAKNFNGYYICKGPHHTKDTLNWKNWLQLLEERWEGLLT